jgi:hypothetical protein
MRPAATPAPTSRRIERSVSPASIRTKTAPSAPSGAVQVELDGSVPPGVQRQERGRCFRRRVVVEPTGDDHDAPLEELLLEPAPEVHVARIQRPRPARAIAGAACARMEAWCSAPCRPRSPAPACSRLGEKAPLPQPVSTDESVSQQKLELQWSLPQFKAGPRNHERRGVTDAAAANPFRLPRLHPGIGRLPAQRRR